MVLAAASHHSVHQRNHSARSSDQISLNEDGLGSDESATRRRCALSVVIVRAQQSKNLLSS